MNRSLSAWQPIDTAPEDKEVLVFVPAWGAIIARYNTAFEEWTSRMQCPVSLSEDREQPTHWMALPAPPEGEDEADLADHERYMIEAATAPPRLARRFTVS
jgi:hypothetical protein